MKPSWKQIPLKLLKTVYCFLGYANLWHPVDLVYLFDQTALHNIQLTQVFISWDICKEFAK